MPLKIGYISQDWSKHNGKHVPNGCTWYRCVVPGRAMGKFGVSTEVGLLAMTKNNQIGVQRIDGVKVSGFDIIVFKLAMHVSALAAVDKTKGNGQKIVVDIDDWFDDLPDTNRAKLITDPERNPLNNRDIYFQIIEIADALICSTEFLYEWYKNKYPHKPVFLVRNAIDSDRWPKYKPPRGRPVIGWMGATPWRALDLEQLSPFFGNFIQRNKLTFHHSGHIQKAQHAADLLGVDKSLVTTEPMQPVTNLPALMKKFNIGIVPLNNIDFNRAKSYLKGLEYAVAGIPFVASDMPEYRLLSSAGVGRVASSPSQWESHMEELLDFKTRSEDARLNYEIATSEFSIGLRAKEWVSVFDEIMEIGN
jgi:glycosyltransferase involved in cell wall biosynthesis